LQFRRKAVITLFVIPTRSHRPCASPPGPDHLTIWRPDTSGSRTRSSSAFSPRRFHAIPSPFALQSYGFLSIRPWGKSLFRAPVSLFSLSPAALPGAVASPLPQVETGRFTGLSCAAAAMRRAAEMFKKGGDFWRQNWGVL